MSSCVLAWGALTPKLECYTEDDVASVSLQGGHVASCIDPVPTPRRPYSCVLFPSRPFTSSGNLLVTSLPWFFRLSDAGDPRSSLPNCLRLPESVNSKVTVPMPLTVAPLQHQQRPGSRLAVSEPVTPQPRGGACLSATAASWRWQGPGVQVPSCRGCSGHPLPCTPSCPQVLGPEAADRLWVRRPAQPSRRSQQVPPSKASRAAARWTGGSHSASTLSRP